MTQSILLTFTIEDDMNGCRVMVHGSGLTPRPVTGFYETRTDAADALVSALGLIKNRRPFTRAILREMRAQVADGASHECEEWRDERDRCELCDRRLHRREA